MDQKYMDFLQDVPAELQSFVLDIDKELTELGCKCDIKTAKAGYVTSYTRNDSDYKLLNFVFRKTGMKIRIYAANITNYQEFLDSLPAAAKKDIIKATDCKKLNGQPCSPYCNGGYAFTMDGEEYKKCRNMAFLMSVTEENKPYITEFLKKEIAEYCF